MVVLFLAQNIEITKFFFIKKTALLKSKIITFFVKLQHKSFVSWNKKSSLKCTFNLHTVRPTFMYGLTLHVKEIDVHHRDPSSIIAKN